MRILAGYAYHPVIMHNCHSPNIYPIPLASQFVSNLQKNTLNDELTCLVCKLKKNNIILRGVK